MRSRLVALTAISSILATACGAMAPRATRMTYVADAPPPPPPPQVEIVTVRIETNMPGAMVSEGGRDFCTAPCNIELPLSNEEVELVLSLPGHEGLCKVRSATDRVERTPKVKCKLSKLKQGQTGRRPPRPGPGSGKVGSGSGSGSGSAGSGATTASRSGAPVWPRASARRADARWSAEASTAPAGAATGGDTLSVSSISWSKALKTHWQ